MKHSEAKAILNNVGVPVAFLVPLNPRYYYPGCFCCVGRYRHSKYRIWFTPTAKLSPPKQSDIVCSMACAERYLKSKGNE